jgi:Ca2+-binding RTX toxin-like protein
VNNVNDAPVTFNQTFTIAENSTVGALVVRANGLNPLNRVAASDEDAGASLTYSLLSGNTGGTFALDSTTGQISIANASLLDFEVPANRSYTLTVRVSDGTLSADAIVTINLTDINETLTLPTLSASSIAENSPNGTVIGTLAATDPEGAPITYTLTNNAGGRFTIVGNELRVANGSLLDFEANASHSITVQASDGVNAQTQNFTVNILDLNEGSLNNLPGSLSGNEDTTFTLSGITLSDPTPGTPNNVTFTVASGSLTLSTSVGGGITGGMVTGNGTASVTITGATQAQINATLADTNGLRFTPAANANGSVLLTMSADDGSGNTDTDAMAITVNAVNDAPTLGNVTSSLTVAENTINAAAQLIDADITLSDIDNPASLNGGNVRVSYVSGGAATDTLSVRHQGNAAGQIGVSGTTVSFGGVAIGTIQASPNNGVGTNALQINLNSSATIAAVEALLENLTYQTSSNTPAATRTLRLTVNDGQGGTSANTDVTVNITAENDAPVIAAPVGAQGFTTAQAYAYTIPGGTFTDPEGNALTYSMAFSTNNGASFTAGTPAWLSFNASTLALAVTAGTGVAGAYQLRLTASDGSTSTDHIIQLAVTNPGNAYTGAVAQTLAGGAGADVIISGDGADLIYGGAGHDTVYGRGGNDSIFLDHITAGSGVNTGNDLAYGGDGNDSMLGEYQIGLTSGSDTLYGEAGNDTLRSSGGNDWLDGGADNDSLIAGSGNDTVYGGTGIDTIFGEENNDSLFGDDGNDWIDGGADNDVLSGGNGDDTLIGGSDSDTMSGGAGADIFEYANFASKFAAFDIITDFETGIDKLRLPFFTGIVEGQGNASGSVLEWYQTGSGGTAKTIIRANPAEYDFYIEMTGHKSLTLSDFIFFGTTGSNGADTITGTAVTDAILGGGGDDIIYGLAGNDLILGDAGNDTIYGSGGTDEIYGGDGNDWIEGGSGINTIYGGNGDDTLNFENYTTGVASILYGGAGNDVFRFSSTMEMRNTGYGIIEDFIKGSDRIWLDGLTFTGIYIGAGDTARTQEMFIAYNASLDLTFITSNRLSWGGNNQIALRGDFATNADSSLNLTASDFIFSNNLVDNAPGDADPTVGVIREALDTTRQGIMGSSGNDTIYAGYSARGWDNIAALDGNDLVIYKYDATAPVDRSGTFSDTGRPDIDLGLGDDRMFLVNARGTAVGADTYGVVSRSFHDTGSDTIVGGNNTKIMNNSSNLVTSQPGVVDLIIAYAQSDDLLGGGGSDIFYGGRGNESNLTGLGGNDTLYGGEGNDGAIGNRFSGDGGNDVLIGGYGSDIMYGGGVTPGLGSGADTFIIYDPLESRNAIGSRDAIMDYGSDDSIILHGFTGIGAGATEVTITNYTASQFGQVNANWTDITASSAGIDFRLTVFGTFSFTGGANGTITFNAGTLLTNVATNFTGTSSADFIAALEGNDTVSAGDGNDSVWGGDGNDSLLGEAGNDSLSGGFGNDTLIGGIGADTLEAGSGVDRFVFSSGDSDTITGMDVIWDFREGNDADIIDLSDSALDALAPGGSLDWGDLVFSTPDQIGGYMTRVTISGTSFGFQLVGYWEKDYNIAAADFVF